MPHCLQTNPMGQNLCLVCADEIWPAAFNSSDFLAKMSWTAQSNAFGGDKWNRPQKLGLDQENHEKKSKHALHARSLFHVVNAFWQKLLDSSKPAHVMNLGYSNIKCHLNHHIHQLLQTCRVALLTLLDDPLHLIIGVVEQGSVSHWRECILSQHHVKKVQGHGTFASLQSDLQFLSNHQLELPSDNLT